jgi:hypothetical protein
MHGELVMILTDSVGEVAMSGAKDGDLRWSWMSEGSAGDAVMGEDEAHSGVLSTFVYLKMRHLVRHSAGRQSDLR